MKRILKGAEPQSLAEFRSAEPSATWKQMRDHDQQAYADCRARAMADQHNLCAYCEGKLDPDKPHRCRVEHLHPKSDTSTGHNWHLDWQNMLATCTGGETEGNAGTPLPANLSCDASKKNCSIEISPLDIPAFPNVFAFDKAFGHLRANDQACDRAAVDAGKLNRTIALLNLNCKRLARQRRLVLFDIERSKKRLRDAGRTPQSAGPLLARKYFECAWPEFFTTIRCCLEQPIEEYLRSVNYNG